MPKAQFVDDGAFVKVRVGASFVKSDSLAKQAQKLVQVDALDLSL